MDLHGIPIETYIELYCNKCGTKIAVSFRGMTRWDGRFCSRECSDAFELKRAQSILDRVPENERLSPP